MSKTRRKKPNRFDERPSSFKSNKRKIHKAERKAWKKELN